MCLCGQYWNETWNSCLACPRGTYNSAPGHNLFCAPCSTTCSENSHKAFQCNATYDLTCVCNEGYRFRDAIPKLCVSMKKHGSKVFSITTESISGQDGAWNNSTTYISSATGPCYWMPWSPDWACISPLALVIIVFLVFIIILLVLSLIITVYYMKKSRANHQQLDAIRAPDTDEGSISTQQENTDEKHQLICVPGVVSVSFTATDHVGESLLKNGAVPPSSLCEQQRLCSLLDLREDEVPLTPIKEVA